MKLYVGTFEDEISNLNKAQDGLTKQFAHNDRILKAIVDSIEVAVLLEESNEEDRDVDELSSDIIYRDALLSRATMIEKWHKFLDKQRYLLSNSHEETEVTEGPQA